MKRYRIAPDAALDLEEIWDYIARDSIDAADAWIGKLHEQMRAIAATPGMGHRRADWAGDRPLLFWPVGNYLILYRVEAKKVEIIGVAHGMRDIPRLIRHRGL